MPNVGTTAQEKKPFQGANRLECGDRIRPFRLADQDGTPVSPLDDGRAGKPLVLVFDCGGAGPSFAEELAALAGALQSQGFSPDASAEEVVVLAITRHPSAEISALKDCGAIPFPLLSDPRAEVYLACGLDPGTIDRSTVSFVLDANLRMVDLFDGGGVTRAPQILAAIRQAAEDPATAPLAGHAPVLVLPRALSARDCADLIAHWHEPAPLWEAEGLTSRGFGEEAGDFVVRHKDFGKLRQRVVRDPGLQRYLDAKLNRRVIPEIRKAFSTKVSRREEYRIAGYDAAEGGSLGAHRDNPTKETRHRRFTLSVALNGGAFKGGELRFNEYSHKGYQVPTGTAIVWSCSLLHEVLPVTAGRRFILGTHLFGN